MQHASADPPRFIPLGDLPGGTFESHAFGLSADGAWVVGSSRSANGLEAFRFNIATQAMMPLGDLPGGPFQSEAYAASRDGSVICGYGKTTTGQNAFRWSLGGGMVAMQQLPLPLTATSVCFGISGDGSVSVGNAAGTRAVRWDANGNISPITTVSGVAYGTAYGTSDSGDVIVGEGADTYSGAFRFTSTTGVVALPPVVVGGGVYCAARAVSPDGTITGGTCQYDSTVLGVAWDAAGNPLNLDDLPGGRQETRPYGVSANGFIVGDASSARGQDAFVWTQAGGIRSLLDVLNADYGLGSALVGWQLQSAQAISFDARVITGYGINPAGEAEAWVAVVPEPSVALLLGMALPALRCFFFRKRRRFR